MVIYNFHGVLRCLANFDYDDVMVIYIVLLHQLWRCLLEDLNWEYDGMEWKGTLYILYY